MNTDKQFEHKRLTMTSQRNITSPIQTRISNRNPCRPTIPGTTATLTRTGISARKTCPLSGFPN